LTQPVDIRPCDLKIVQDILHDVLPPDAQVWVFGSRAKWTTKDSSDLDLAIDAGRALTSKEASALADAFEESDLPYTVDVADMWSVSDTFREIIERDKVALQSSGKKGKAVAGWRTATIGDFVTLQRGIDLPSNARTNGSVPIMGSSGITGYHDKAACKGPGVTVGRSGASIGAVSYIEEDYWPLNTCLYVKDFHGNNPRFCYFFLETRDLAALNSGSAQPSLNRNFVHPLSASFPKRGEQDSIVALLGSLDDKIDLNRRMNETLEAMARAVFKDWFLDFGPVRAKAEGSQPLGLSPDIAALFPDALDDEDKPVGWRLVQLEEVCQLNPTERLGTGVASPYLDMAALPTFGSCHDSPIPRAFASGAKFRDNDTLLARITPCLENGKTAYVRGLGDNVIGWGSTEFIVIRPKAPFPPEYGYVLARNEVFRDHAIQSMTGTSGRQRVQTDQMASFQVTEPSPAVLRAFGDVLHPWFERIASNAEESRTLAQLRDLLLPKLMSGAIRLKDAEKMVGALP